MGPLFRSLECDNQLCKAAAGQCIGAIRDCIGPGIFAGRLTAEQKAGMEASQDVPPVAGKNRKQIREASKAPGRKTNQEKSFCIYSIE